MGAYHGKKDRKGKEAPGRDAFTADLLTLQISTFQNGGATGPRITTRKPPKKGISKMPIITEEDEHKAELRSESQSCDVSTTALATLPEEEEEEAADADASGIACGAATRVSDDLERPSARPEPPDRPGRADAPGISVGSGERRGADAAQPGDEEPMEVDTVLSEPDYGGDAPGLIKPKKLINPVKESRRHQDMHRELLMKNKRGQGLQPKPELLRVLDQRKWDQVGRQRREMDGETAPSGPLQQELLKRFQRLEQLDRELELSLVPGERPGAGGAASIPEFIRVRDNLRRTRIAMETEQGTA